jgi:hypothetical protein
LAHFEQAQIFHPAQYPDGNWQPAGLHFEDAWFESEDGVTLHGWFVPHKNPRAVALFAHGNAGHVAHRAETLRTLHDRHGHSVLCFDYRGYGRSAGTPDERGILQDARAARRWLARRTGVKEHDIVLMGRSLGRRVVVDLAAQDGARGLILASTFTSLPDVGKHHMPFLPVGWLMSNRFDSVTKIASYEGPLLKSQGDADEIIPFQLGLQLHTAAPGPKRMIVIPGGRHNDLQTEQWRNALDEFIESLHPVVTTRATGL